jgi:hypothetical protein
VIVEVLVGGVHVDGRTGGGFEFGGSADVVDVGVSDDDGLHLELMVVEDLLQMSEVGPIAGIDDDGFAGGFIAEDRAVALQGAGGKDFVDH